jgi:hypothetical protein
MYGVSPALARANGNMNDVGGAVFNVQYTPGVTKNGVTSPVLANMHWIQSLKANYDDYGKNVGGKYVPGPDQYRLDNGAAMGNSPFYDDGGAAGTYQVRLASGRLQTRGYFMDRPWAIEDEALEAPFVADVHFQMVLATLTTRVVAGVTYNRVTLYGGERWGYHTTAVDQPPPPGRRAQLPVGPVENGVPGPNNDIILVAAVPLPGAASMGLFLLGGLAVITLRQRVKHHA